jgi:hypothetical protein
MEAGLSIWNPIRSLLWGLLKQQQKGHSVAAALVKVYCPFPAEVKLQKLPPILILELTPVPHSS